MNSISASLLLWLLPAACLHLLYRRFLTTKQAENEPIQVPPLLPIPIIGHAVGLMKEKMTYYDKLSKRSSLPIFTVVFSGRSKVYVVTAPDLAMAVFRNVKTLSFTALAVSVIGRISLLGKAALETVSLNANGADGEVGYMTQVIKAVHSSLAPGEALTQMTQEANVAIVESLSKLATKEGSTRIKMFAWMRHEIAMATTRAVYGPDNPFRDPGVMAAFWDFERDFTSLLIGILPSWTAPRGHKGRASVQKAFEAYFAREGHRKGSKLVRARYDVAARNGLSALDIAKLETTMAIGILGTTAPASFWMLYSIFSHPTLLAALRTELAPALTTTTTTTPRTHNLSTSHLLKSSPLFTSTWNETLRHTTCSTTARLVEHDTLLLNGHNQHLLLAGGVIQMPSRASHLDPSLWGPDAETFDPARFLKLNLNHSQHQKKNNDAPSVAATGISKKKKKKKPPPAGSFRPFSGGTTLCPGRHLAAAEIMAMVGMMVLRFDVAPVDEGAGSGWTDPKPYASSLAAGVLTPANDPEVEVRVREGFEGGRWGFGFEEGKGGVLKAADE